MAHSLSMTSTDELRHQKDNIRAKENAEEDARVKAYKEKLTPIS